MIEGAIRTGGAKGLSGELPGHVHYGTEGPPGGHYIPKVNQTGEKTAVITFTASKPDMPAVASVEIELPAGPRGERGEDGNVSFDELTEAQRDMLRGEKGEKGDKGDPGERGERGATGPAGPKGDDYELTTSDKTEIAAMAAGLVEVPEVSGGAPDCVITSDVSAPFAGKEVTLSVVSGSFDAVAEKANRGEKPNFLYCKSGEFFSAPTYNFVEAIRVHVIPSDSSVMGIAYFEYDDERWDVTFVKSEEGEYISCTVTSNSGGDVVWDCVITSLTRPPLSWDTSNVGFSVVSGSLKAVWDKVNRGEKPNVLYQFIGEHDGDYFNTFAEATSVEHFGSGEVGGTTSDVPGQLYIGFESREEKWELYSNSEYDIENNIISSYNIRKVSGNDSGGNVELDTTLTQSGKAADAKAVGDKIAEITGISPVEPADDDIPKIFFGGALQQTKDEKVVPFRYISKTEEIIGFAEIKAQGNSSMSYPKKNQTVKMFKDADCTEKLKVDFKGWGKQNKHVYKANWIDLTHARNVVSARLWGDVLRSRADYESLPELLRTSPNQGAVDGFPVKVYAAGVYQGRYTLNIPKDAWMANMDKDLDTHCILCGENYVSGCFRAAANINESDWTDEIHDTVPASIKTRWNQVISFVMNSTDEEFKANLSQYFYVDSLIDYYLFGLASCGLDAFGKNQLYMTYDGQKWIATMYDMDSTWGLFWNGSSIVATDYDRSEYQDFKDGEGNLLYIRLENLFYEELQARWEELRSGALSIENIINRFERFTDIAPAELVSEDYASTTADGKFTSIPSKTTSTIQQIRSYAVARHAWCDTYVAELTGGDVEPDEPDVPDVPVEPDVPDEPDVPGDAEIDYTLNPLDGVNWSSTTYNLQTGAVVEGSANNHTTEKIYLQNCVYNFQNGTGNTYGAIWIWDENDNFICGVENSGSIGKFVAKAGWKYAFKVASASTFDPSTVSLMPVDQSVNASGISTVTIDGASVTWSDMSKGAETVITEAMAASGFAAIATANEVLNKINKCSHAIFLNSGVAGGIDVTGVAPVLYINCYLGDYYLIARGISAADAPAIVGTVIIN